MAEEFKLLHEQDLLVLHDKAKRELELKSTDLFQSLMDQLGKHTEWLELYRKEKSKLKKLQQLTDKRWSELFFEYRFDKRKVSSEGVLLVHPKEIENAIKKDDDWINTKARMNQQEMVVEYIKSILDLFGDRKWLMKDVIAFMKLDGDAI